MFIDVCGAAELVETLGNAGAQAAVASLVSTLSDTAARHAGRTVKTIGSQIMCVFPTARNAATAAAEAQRVAGTAIRKRANSLAVRIGFQYGPVIHQDEDVFGDAVNVAARVLSHAKPGQILPRVRSLASYHRKLASRFAGSGTATSRAKPNHSTCWS